MSGKKQLWGLWKIHQKEWLIDTFAREGKPYVFMTRKTAEAELKSRYKKGDRTDPLAGYFRHCVIPRRFPQSHAVNRTNNPQNRLNR